MCNVLCNKYQRGEILFFSVSLSGYPWIKSPDWALWIPKRLHLRQTLKDASESGLCLSSCWVAWLQPCKTIFIFSILWTVNHCLVDWPEFESAFFFLSFHITYHYSLHYSLTLHDFALLTEIKKLLSLSPSFSIIYMIQIFSKSNNTIILEFIIIL